MMVRAAMCVVALGVVLAGSAEAQTEGTYDWGRDDCSYVFRQGAWRVTDTCRVRRSATVYDTYSRQTRQFQHRFDESDRRFLTFLDLKVSNPVWMAMAKDGSGIFYKQNGQWIDFNAAVRAQAVSQAQYNAIVARNKANPVLQAQIAAVQGMLAASNARMTSIWLQ
jgi:hypothetical protein